MVIFVTDPSGRATYLAPEWRMMTGLSAAQALGSGWEAVVHPDDLPCVRATVAAAVRAETEFTIRYRLAGRAGGYAWVTAGAVPSYGPPGRTFLGFFGSIIPADEGVHGDDAEASGVLGSVHANRSLPNEPPGSTLERAADHLIIAHSLFSEEEGSRHILPVLETALHLVGVELARAEQDGLVGLH